MGRSNKNLKDIIQTNNHRHFDPDLECSNPIFAQNALVYDAVLSNQVWLLTAQHLEDRVDHRVMFLLHRPSL